jgi:hypothetical protein
MSSSSYPSLAVAVAVAGHLPSWIISKQFSIPTETSLRNLFAKLSPSSSSSRQISSCSSQISSCSSWESKNSVAKLNSNSSFGWAEFRFNFDFPHHPPTLANPSLSCGWCSINGWGRGEGVGGGMGRDEEESSLCRIANLART